MKDLPHFMKRLNRKVIRSEHREEESEAAFARKAVSEMSRKQTLRQKKKQAKAAIAKARKMRTPTPLDPEERNKKMAKRVPIFDRYKAKRKTAKPTKKRTPRI